MVKTSYAETKKALQEWFEASSHQSRYEEEFQMLPRVPRHHLSQPADVPWWEPTTRGSERAAPWYIHVKEEHKHYIRQAKLLHCTPGYASRSGQMSQKDAGAGGIHSLAGAIGSKLTAREVDCLSL